MSHLSWVSHLITTHLYFIGWRDLLEIIFFSFLFYWLSVWLSKDRQNNLLFYFYAYFLISCTSYILQLPTLSYCLFIFSPGFIMLFILVHERTLQRNFITFKKNTPQTQLTNNWLETFLRACLINVNNNKKLYCVIEHTDNLESFISTQHRINSLINKELIGILLESQSFDQEKMIWINSEGNIRGINASWHNIIDNLILPNQIAWQQDALLSTTHTDALFIHIDPKTKQFTLICKGSIISELNSGQVMLLIKKHIGSTQVTQNLFTKKGTSNGITIKKNSEQQRTS